MTILNGPVYIYADIATPGLATNCCLGDGLNHVHIMECPGGYKTFSFLRVPESSLSLRETWCDKILTWHCEQDSNLWGNYTLDFKIGCIHQGHVARNSVTFQCGRVVSIELWPACFYFLSASWTLDWDCWAGKCCYCCLLELWLLYPLPYV